MGPDATNMLKFVKQVAYYRNTNNRSLLKKRADQVYDTYLGKGAEFQIKLSDAVRGVAWRGVAWRGVRTHKYTRARPHVRIERRCARR